MWRKGSRFDAPESPLLNLMFHTLGFPFPEGYSVQSYTRHQLKQDKFAVATKEAVHWSVEHRNTLVLVAVVLAVLILGGAVAYQVIDAKDDKASLALNDAIQTFRAPLRTPDQPVNPNLRTFTSPQERADAALKQFLQIANDYSYTKNGKYARYLAGTAAIEKGDTAQGESLLKQAAGYNKDVAAVAKLALASLYRSQNKESDAAALYRDAIAMDAVSAPRASVQIELADMYEQNNKPGEAVKVYEEMAKHEEEVRKKLKDPAAAAQKTPLESLATQKIEELKKKK